jgi:hypothetical protein
MREASLECTGIAAGWCPIHGDCICPIDEHGDHITMDGESFGMDNPACPLHGDSTNHGEDVVVNTLWGDVVLQGD